MREPVIEFMEAGTGEVTVVFEAGLGKAWTVWNEVASEVALRTRVFAYSRPGYGGSAPTTEARTATRIVEDLRALLTARGLAPPYLLVGHSIGGPYMELFAKAHPEEVAGLVLVDPRHRDFASACQRAGYPGLSASIVASLSREERAEYEAFANVSAEIEAAGTFGRYPVRVLTATAHKFTAEVQALWESLHGALAREAEDGEQLIFTGAGHDLQTERPREVAEVILRLVPSSPSPCAAGRGLGCVPSMGMDRR